MTFFSMSRPSVVLFALAVLLASCGGGDEVDNTPAPNEVQKASCGNGDVPESGLQGQVPAALRASGFKGFNCNLEMVAQSRNDGGNWQHAFFKDPGGHNCNYYGSTTAIGRPNIGVAVVDTTEVNKAAPTTFLTTTGMIDPWESLKVNERRQILVGLNARNGGFTAGNGGPELDIYDLSGDCRFPQLLSTLPVGLAGSADQFVADVRGHEGSFSPDGLTYYGTNVAEAYIYPIDITNTTKPKLLTKYLTSPSIAQGRAIHGLSISEDGNRAYLALYGQGVVSRALGTPPNNGMQILDVSQVQRRVPNPKITVVGEVMWDDGGGAQHTIAVSIKGKPYVIHADENGSAANGPGVTAACAAGLPAFPFARIIDISDESKPVVVSKLMLEVNQPRNCDKVLPDLVGLGGFTYGSHYCSVDNRRNATTLACGYFNSGIRVFDIRDPTRVKEIAYFNPPGTTTPSPGSLHVRQNNWRAGGPDWCTAQIQLDAATGTLRTMCADNGYFTLRFKNNVWPFPESSTPPGLQN